MPADTGSVRTGPQTGGPSPARGAGTRPGADPQVQVSWPEDVTGSYPGIAAGMAREAGSQAVSAPGQPGAPGARSEPGSPTVPVTRPRRARRPAAPTLDVAARMNLLAQALDAGGDRLDPTAVARASAALERAGHRMRLGAELTVVALVGATGSGKSSLFNALAGMEIAEVAARRPTTSEPTACSWGDGDADPLLDWLGIPLRNRTRRESILDAGSQAALHGLVLLDLPDHDSAFVNHRLEVDRLVELVDLLIWVVDPQKYADEALHSGYLRPFSSRSDVMLVVLNQVDRLGADETRACGHDLRRLLEADGLGEVRLLTTSAVRGDGVDGLREVLAGAVRARASAVGRTLADLGGAAAQLAAGVAAREPDLGQLGVGARLVGSLADAAGVPVVLAALDADYRRRAGLRLGWPFLRWWRRAQPDPLRQTGLKGAGALLRDLVGATLPTATPAQQAQVDLAARKVADVVADPLPPRWALAVRSASGWHRGGTGLSAALDAAVREVDLTPPAPRWWLAGQVVQTAFALIAIGGFGWLAGIGVLDWLRVAPVVVPFIGPLALPTAMLLGGLTGGGVLVGVSQILIDSGARQRRQRLTAQLHEAIGDVARTWVLAGVSDVLADHREVRECLESLR